MFLLLIRNWEFSRQDKYFRQRCLAIFLLTRILVKNVESPQLVMIYKRAREKVNKSK